MQRIVDAPVFSESPVAKVLIKRYDIDGKEQLYYMGEEAVKMLCHFIIDLSNELCTKSDDWTKLVQR